MTAPPAPENEPSFQGRVVPSPAPKDAFPGAGGKLQYPAPVVGAGYICSRPWNKNGVSLKIIYIVVFLNCTKYTPLGFLILRPSC